MPVGTSEGEQHETDTDFQLSKIEQQQSISSFFGRIFGSGDPAEDKIAIPTTKEFKGGETPVIKGDPDPGYPSNEDADFAKKHGFAYGQEWENFFNGSAARVMGYDFFTKKDKAGKVLVSGPFVPTSAEGMNLKAATVAESKVLDLNDPKFKEIKEKLKDNYAKAALAVNRDPIASLGFAPNKVTMDLVMKPNEANVAGVYSRDTDQIYSNLASHSNIVHESIHRGLEQLLQRNSEAVEAFKKMKLNEEYIVRHIMDKTMGNPEEGAGEAGDKQIKAARYHFSESTFAKEHKEGLKKLQDLAAEEIAKKHPGGPR